MIPELRQRFNSAFTDARYAALTREVNRAMYWPVDFRLAESPLFLDEQATRALIAAADDITGQLATPAFRAHSATAVPKHLAVPHEVDEVGGHAPSLRAGGCPARRPRAARVRASARR